MKLFESMPKPNNSNNLDERLIISAQKIYPVIGRLSLFVIYFWFGFLKVVSLSPANPLVGELLEKTLPFITFQDFIFLFGLFEMLIGFLFIIPKFERVAIAVFFIHMGMVVLPLLLLPATIWQAPFIPTLEGQYIIKNLALIAIVFSLWAGLTPLKNKKK